MDQIAALQTKMERQEGESMDGENLELVLLDAESTEQSEPLAKENSTEKPKITENCFELSKTTNDEVTIIHETLESTNNRLSVRNSAKARVRNAATDKNDKIAQTISDMLNLISKKIVRKKKSHWGKRVTVITVSQEEEEDATAKPPGPKKLCRKTFSAQEQVIDISENEEDLGEMPAPRTLPLSKDESIQKVIEFYSHHLLGEMSSEGLTPIPKLHQEAIDDIYQEVTASDSLMSAEHWSSMRLQLWKERQKFEKSTDSTVKAMMISLERFKEEYEVGMRAALQKSVTTDPPPKGVTFESIVSAVHEQYIKTYAQQHIDSHAHPILLPLLAQQVESEYKNLLSTNHVIEHYKELMKGVIMRNVDCSERLLENLDEECVQMMLAAGRFGGN